MAVVVTRATMHKSNGVWPWLCLELDDDGVARYTCLSYDLKRARLFDDGEAAVNTSGGDNPPPDGVVGEPWHPVLVRDGEVYRNMTDEPDVVRYIQEWVLRFASRTGPDVGPLVLPPLP